jgi:hypothetical protein
MRGPVVPSRTEAAAVAVVAAMAATVAQGLQNDADPLAIDC